MALKQRDRVDEAIAHYRETSRLRPRVPRPTPTSPTLCSKKGASTKPSSAITPRYESAPSNAEAYNNLAYLNTELGKWDEALTCCLEALRLRPDFGEAFSNLGDLVRQGRYKFTTEQIQHMVTLVSRENLSPEDAGPLHFALAGVREQERD